MNSLATYLRLEAAMLLLDSVDEALADKVRDRMDAVWRKLSPHDLTWLNSRGGEELPAQQPSPHCDEPACRRPPTFRCSCQRCNPSGKEMMPLASWSADVGDAFHACEAHVGSAAIQAKHFRIYPSRELCLIRPGESGTPWK